MGLFTALKEEVYPIKRVETFPTSPAFHMETARALAWAAQLAYETAEEEKFERILGRWGWRLDSMLDGIFSSALPVSTTRGYVAHAGDATIVAFAGTEPTNLLQWVQNFSIGIDAGVHEGFEAGVEAVWEVQLLPLIGTASALYFTGHSLGGALSVAAAHRLCKETPAAAAKIRGVYTIGMPRVGIERFAQAYNDANAGPQPPLGQRTFRLVHGADIVPHVPTTVAPVSYRHVGHALACPHGGRFDPQELRPPQMETADADEPVSIRSFLTAGDDTANGSLPSFPAENILVVPIIEAMPRPVRDHLMDRYLRALGADL